MYGAPCTCNRCPCCGGFRAMPMPYVQPVYPWAPTPWYGVTRTATNQNPWTGSSQPNVYVGDPGSEPKP